MRRLGVSCAFRMGNPLLNRVAWVSTLETRQTSGPILTRYQAFPNLAPPLLSTGLLFPRQLFRQR